MLWETLKTVSVSLHNCQFLFTLMRKSSTAEHRGTGIPTLRIRDNKFLSPEGAKAQVPRKSARSGSQHRDLAPERPPLWPAEEPPPNYFRGWRACCREELPSVSS
jgi:hypothetical protein